MVLELLVEMPERGQQRIGRGLPEPAERGFADHPPEFIEIGQILLALMPLGDAG